MARKLYEKQGIRRRNGQLASGVTFVVYTDVAGTVLADISATSGGSAIAGSEITTADIAGLGPAAFRYYGPTDGTDTLYLRCPADTSLGVQEIEADEDERLDALEAGGGGGGGIAATLLDAKGDLIAASAADTAARVAVGANGRVLTADSTATAGIGWAAGTEWVNAKTYLDGDGVTEDAAAVTALEAAAAGKVLYFPNGTYQLALHDHPADSAYKVGLVVGTGTTVIMAAAATLKLAANQVDGYVVINREISAGTDQHIRFIDMTVDGNGANQASGVHHGITLIRAGYVQHVRCRVFNCRGTAAFGNGERSQFEAQLSSNLSYVDCVAYRTAGSTAGGFGNAGCTNVSYRGCTAYGMTVANGFGHNGANHLSYIGCHAYLNAINGFNSEISADVTYDSCVSGGRATALLISSPFTDGQVLGNTGSGFAFNGTLRGQAIGCRSSHNTVAGIEFAFGSQVEVQGGAYTDNAVGASYISNPPELCQIDPSVQFARNSTADLSLPSGTMSMASSALTAPSVPATTVRLVNPYPFPVTVFVAGGTVTVVAVDDIVTGMTAGPVPLRAGGTIKLTYSSAPTWVWLRTGGPAFSLASYPSLALWLDANRIAQADNSAVASWGDASGHNRHATQATGSKQPTLQTAELNGRPVVRFDGGNDFLETAAFSAALTQPTTIVIVAKVNAIFFDRTLFDGIAGGNRHALLISTTQWSIYAGAGPIAGGTSDDTTWHVFTAVFNGASSLLRVDGTQVLTGNAGTLTLTGLVLGIAEDRASGPFNGDMAEVAIYNRTLSATELAVVERHLGVKYALTVV